MKGKAIRNLFLHLGDAECALQQAKDGQQDPKAVEMLSWLNDAGQYNLRPRCPEVSYVRIGLTNALVHLKDNTTSLDAPGQTLRDGGDTNTIACIAGGFAERAAWHRHFLAAMRRSGVQHLAQWA